MKKEPNNAPRRAVLFDMDGVLLHGWHADPKKRRRWDTTLKEDLGIDPEAFQSFFPTVFEKKVLTGQMALEEALQEFLSQLGSSVDPQTFIDYWMSRDGVVDKPMWELVERLKKTGRVQLYIATNQEHVRANYLWNKIGFKHIFDDIFYAAAFKAPKPERAFFVGCEKKMPANTDEKPLFFDDHEVYVEGARAAGWEAILHEGPQTCTEHPFIKELLS